VDLSSTYIQKSHSDFHRASQYDFGNYSNLLRACNIDVSRRNNPITAVEFFNRLYRAKEEEWFGIECGEIWTKSTTGEKVFEKKKDNTVYIPKLRIEGGRYQIEKLHFVCECPGPYDEEVLAEYWYDLKLPSTKKPNGFWTEKQVQANMKLLKEQGINLKPGFILKTYPDLYDALCSLYGSYWDALKEFIDDPKEVYKLLKVDRRLFGIYVERCVWEIIRTNSNCFDFQITKGNGRLDLWSKKKAQVIDIKTSVHAKLDKEIKKYVPKFGGGNVIAACLYGPEDFDKVINGVRQMSIFLWIQENSEDFNNVQSILEELRTFKGENDYKTGDSQKTAEYFFNLTKRIFALALEGGTHQQIAEKVYLSRRQVGRILQKKSLIPYIDEKLFSEYQKKQKTKMEIKEKRNISIVKLSDEGYSFEFIANKFGMSSSGVQDVVKVMKTKETTSPELQTDRSVRVYTIEGKYVKTLPSAAACSRELGVSKSTISRLLQGIPAMHNFQYVLFYNETFTEERLQQKLKNVRAHKK